MDPLRELLRELNRTEPQDRHKVEARIWERFGTEAAVFVLDMAGFSLTTQKHGIIHYMAMVETMRHTVEPMIAERGHLVKFEADNCFATFDEVGHAIETAVAIQRHFRSVNRETHDDRDIHLSVGIDFGRILLLEHALWGDAVNLASKLGEDVAESGEILITQSAWERMAGATGFDSEEANYTVSGLKLSARRIFW